MTNPQSVLSKEPALFQTIEQYSPYHGPQNEMANLIQIAASAIRILARDSGVQAEKRLQALVERADASLTNAGALARFILDGRWGRTTAFGQFGVAEFAGRIAAGSSPHLSARHKGRIVGWPVARDLDQPTGLSECHRRSGDQGAGRHAAGRRRQHRSDPGRRS